MGGGRGGRMSGGAGPGGTRPEMTNVSFKIWTHIQLAEKPR
jgi:hypothetical protein